MMMNKTGAIAVAAAAVLMATILGCRWTDSRRRDSLEGLPRVFLWAWERPENLGFLDPDEAGVAILAKTLLLEGGRISPHPRMQPIRLPQEAATLAVIRIETAHLNPSPGLLDRTVAEIVETAESTPARGIQIDFDALESERPFYRDLLEELKKRLPPNRPLSVTALASWCLYDDWISDLPADEAVPMLFRLGRDETNVKRYLRTGRDFRPAISQSSVGVSMDELPADLPRGRRIYIFNPAPWTEESVRRAMEFARSMQ